MNKLLKILWSLTMCLVILTIGTLRTLWAFFYYGCTIIDRKFESLFEWVME